jgi:transcriptional regulator with XRE-family HTH domain
MAHPIYRFGEILRELRKGAGLTVLGAAEATEYGNYERWETGATRVGTQHLGATVAAFGVDDVPMFLNAWLVDRFTPSPRQSAVDLAHVNLAKTYRQLPRTTVNLGERKDWVVEPARHADVALLYLVARYRRNHRVVLPPAARKPLPTRLSDADVLTSAYGDVIDDVIRLAARVLLRAGRTFSDALRSKSAVGGRSSYPRTSGPWARAVHESIDRIGALLPIGHAAAVIELTEYALGRVDKAMSTLDDSSGWFSQVIPSSSGCTTKPAWSPRPNPWRWPGDSSPSMLTASGTSSPTRSSATPTCSATTASPRCAGSPRSGGPGCPSGHRARTTTARPDGSTSSG